MNAYDRLFVDMQKLIVSHNNLLRLKANGIGKAKFIRNFKGVQMHLNAVLGALEVYLRPFRSLKPDELKVFDLSLLDNVLALIQTVAKTGDGEGAVWNLALNYRRVYAVKEMLKSVRPDYRFPW